MSVIPTTGFLANSGKLERGDIVGFVSRRPDLDYFHTGFVAFDKTGDTFASACLAKPASRA